MSRLEILFNHLYTEQQSKHIIECTLKNTTFYKLHLVFQVHLSAVFIMHYKKCSQKNKLPGVFSVPILCF